MCFCWLIVTVVLKVSSASLTRKTNPIGKAVELLDVLKAQLESDMKSDGDAYFSFAQWATNETATAKRITVETKQSIMDLTTSIAEEQAQRDQMIRGYEEAGVELTKGEQELSEAKNVRSKERKEYESQEAILAEGVDQLQRSLAVLGQQFEEAPGVSLLNVATKLQSTLERADDLHLSAEQKETLNLFVQASMTHRPAKVQHAIAPDFLQVKRRQEPEAGNYGKYESQSSGVVSTLQRVLDKTKKSRDQVNSEEERAAVAFQKLDEQLTEQIEVAKQRLMDLKSQISQSKESQAQMESDLQAAHRLLKSTFEHLQEVQQDFTAKTRAYKDRAIKRSDETVAVGEAIRVLTSETAKALTSKQSIGTPDFLQLSRETRTKAAQVINLVPSPGLALLAMQAHTRMKAWSSSADPFDKVKSMIRDMLQRLTTEANQEAEHHAWCSSEISKTTKSQENKQNKVQKLINRLDAASNEIIKLKNEIAQATGDINEMRDSMSTATRIRVEEEAKAANSLREYRDAQVLLRHVLNLLKKYYHAEAHAENASNDGSAEITGENNREGLGGGVVAILEIAEADFVQLEEDAAAEESASARMYKHMANELQIRMASFTKDVEYKARAKIKFEAAMARNTADKGSYEKELGAINDYLDKLTGECVAKVEPYEERKLRREQELESLKEALHYLNGNAMA